MPRIESYRFGSIVIDGRNYTHDVIILPDRVIPDWWRQSGHTLRPGDLSAVFDAAPEALVVGIGASGRMRVTRETEEALTAAGIHLFPAPTEEACQMYNRLRERQRVAAALHLTC